MNQNQFSLKKFCLIWLDLNLQDLLQLEQKLKFDQHALELQCYSYALTNRQFKKMCCLLNYFAKNTYKKFTLQKIKNFCIQLPRPLLSC